MKLKPSVDLIDFIHHVRLCACEVWLETAERDRLDLKDTLSQYALVVLCDPKGIPDNLCVFCSEADYPLLATYLEE